MELEEALRLGRPLTSKDVDELPYDANREYELVGGELFVSTRPEHRHQQVIYRILLRVGPAVTAMGGDPTPEPGVVWEDEGGDNVSPDIAFRLGGVSPAPGQKLRVCPEIVVEVLSKGRQNDRRDLVAKRDLYQRRGALEYWIVDPNRVSVARLVREGDAWREHLLSGDDVLATPLLADWPGVRVRELFP